MISTSCNIREFITAIKGKNYFDIMELTEQEATEAERLSYRSKRAAEVHHKDSTQYTILLKSFLFFIRYGVKPAGLGQLDYQLFQSVWEDIIQSKQNQVPCQPN